MGSANLVANKVAASLSTAPTASTLGDSTVGRALRGVRANGAFLATLRSPLVFDNSYSSWAFDRLGSLRSKGQTPVVFTLRSQLTSQEAPRVSAVMTFKLA